MSFTLKQDNPDDLFVLAMSKKFFVDAEFNKDGSLVRFSFINCVQTSSIVPLIGADYSKESKRMLDANLKHFVRVLSDFVHSIRRIELGKLGFVHPVSGVLCFKLAGGVVYFDNLVGVNLAAFVIRFEPSIQPVDLFDLDRVESDLDRDIIHAVLRFVRHECRNSGDFSVEIDSLFKGFLDYSVSPSNSSTDDE